MVSPWSHEWYSLWLTCYHIWSRLWLARHYKRTRLWLARNHKWTRLWSACSHEWPRLWITWNHKLLFFTDSKNPLGKNFNGRKHRKSVEKTEEGSKGSTMVGKTVRNTQLVRTCFEYKQTWLFATKGTCQAQFWELFQVCKPLNTSIWKQKWFNRLKKFCFYCFMESGQPYYGPFMDSHWP